MPPPLDLTTLNIENPSDLLAYLRQMGHIAPDETPRMQTLSGGVSNRTVWVTRPNGEAWVLKQALAKLRVPVDWFSSPARVHREALGLRHLAELAPPGTIPPLVFEDHTAHLIAMQAVPEPHANWKTLLLAGELEPDHVRQFGTLLAMIHAGAAARRAELEPLFADRSFFETLRLEPYYGYSATQVPAAAPFLHALMAETRQRTLTLVHGDYSPKNILVHAGRLILLDHEVIHWGDPAFDLGFSLTHLLSKAHHLPAQRAAFAAAALAYWQTYASQGTALPWAADLEAYAVRHTLACLLARVAGRSPLEYMSPAERVRQQAIVVALMAAPPRQIEELVSRFVTRLDEGEGRGPARNTYDQVADHYARYLQDLSREEFSFNHDLVIPRLLDLAGEVAGLTVLDAGCGEGLVARLLAARGAQVTGIDIAPRLIELAQAQDAAHAITYLTHDLSQPLPGYQAHFDLVVSNLVLNDVPDYQGFIATLGSVTKAQGRVLLSINNPYSALIREKVDSYFDSGQATLYNMAKEGVKVYYFHRTLEEYISAFRQAGFLLRTLLDLQLPDEVAANLPDRYRALPYHTWYARFPFFLILEFIKHEA